MQIPQNDIGNPVEKLIKKIDHQKLQTQIVNPTQKTGKYRDFFSNQNDEKPHFTYSKSDFVKKANEILNIPNTAKQVQQKLIKTDPNYPINLSDIPLDTTLADEAKEIFTNKIRRQFMKTVKIIEDHKPEQTTREKK